MSGNLQVGVFEGAGYFTFGTQPVGTKIANELGIYDMNGNASEWCWDSRGYPGLNYRSVRGGSWADAENWAGGYFNPFSITSGNSWLDDLANSKTKSRGLRLARTPNVSPAP
jgi:formylglycine-generating enzyme required for sulfatase activity